MDRARDQDGQAKPASTPDGTVYVVDDDRAVLNMLQALVATIGVKVRPFSSAQDFLEAYRPLPCACVVCDLRMPGMDGLELQRRLNAMDAAPPLIFLTGYAEVNVAVEAMKHGAFDFLEKPFSAQALLAKIQSALDLSRTSYVRWREESARKARLALLTVREQSIAEHVVAGRSSREISQLLGLSVRTVENHRTRIMEKLHVGSTVDLVKLFLTDPGSS